MSSILETIRQQGVVAIVRATDAREALQTIRVLVRSGLRVLEVSLVTPNALDLIRMVVTEVPGGVHIGVGTALTPEHVRLAAAAGATFVVSPVLNERVLKTTLDLGLASLPGVATPTEALRAREWGSTLVKLFPGSLWSPGALSELLAALPNLELVPTGGITPTSAAEWIRSGATALGIGASLTKSSDPAATVRTLLSTIAGARS